LGQNFKVFSMEKIRDVGVSESEHSWLTQREIIFENFQPM